MKSHTRLAIGAALIAGLVSLSFAPAFAQQSAKACEAQWKTNKASIQASGKKKKDFITECRGVNPTATAPARSDPTTTSAKASGPAKSASTNTSAKACEEQWKTNKPTIQASGKTKKVFIGECRTGSAAAVVPAKPTPTAAAPAKPAPTSTSSSTSAKACEEQWKANKPSIQASGKTKKVFVSECRTGSVIVGAPAKPTPSGAAPSSESKTPVKPTTTAAAPPSESTTAAKPATAPTTAGTPAGANQYSTVVSAKLRCPLDTIVWVNLNSGIYHFSSKKAYGTTKRGAYMCEKDTSAAGFRAAKNEKHP